MKLLFDHNISPDLIHLLRDLFPNSSHVYLLDLHEKRDAAVWKYARENGFTVVSKDADFAEISMLEGFPPKLLWLRIGNCRTSDIEELIRSNHQNIVDLHADDRRGILSLFGKGAR